MISTVFMYLNAALSFIFVGFMMYKKMDIKLTLFGAGLFLLFTATAMGYDLKIGKKIENTGFVILNPLKAVVDQFITTLQKAGIIILFLGGYSSYMSKIGANNATIKLLTKPLSKIKSPYILVPILFVIGNVLSLVIPSASMLAIILLATLYPLLKQVGMSKATGAAVIATAATIMPTPLGGDNIVIANELKMSATEYVFKYHILVSAPTLAVMTTAHYFTQKIMDKRDIKNGKFQNIEIKTKEKNEIVEIKGKWWNRIYAFLPLLPIFLLVVVFIVNTATPNSTNVNLDVTIATIVCLLVAMAVESIKFKSVRTSFDKVNSFFTGMGSAFGVVALLAAASLFVSGLKNIHLISTLQHALENSSGNGWILPLIMVLLTAVVVLLSGSGVALFYAMAPLMVGLAASAGIAAQAVTVPMGLAGNLLRAVSPVSAVVVIIAGYTKLSPITIVKRTAIPMLSGVVFMLALSMIIWL